MNFAEAGNIEDLRTLACRRLPRIVRDFLEGGAEEQQTLRANREVFAGITFAPRTLVDVSQRSQRVTVLDRSFDSPLGISPIGAAGLFWHEADIHLARAAHHARVPFVLSTHSFVPLPRVAREAGTPPWFQLYLGDDRQVTEMMLQQAVDAGSDVLVLTTDVPVGGNREYNERNGFGVPFRLGLRNAVDGLRHPGWLLRVFGPLGLGGGVPAHFVDWGARRDRLNWNDFLWLRRSWPGKLLVKGILTVDDARLAARHGADGIFISNHGGRQLDGAPSPVDVLPPIAAAVGGQLAIMVDGGFRRGADIVKALALGADMVFVGRPAIYGVAAGGEDGVRRALRILGSEVDRVMALLGCCSMAELGPQFVHYPRREARMIGPRSVLRAATAIGRYRA
ncbi:MAG TPA: alpha-hydroxy acid oxidase [Azospira sp.]|nr:alpha-hydroxy acid oxidase [Azospira sp.]